MTHLEELTALSRRYGGNPDYVIAGGGNTSFKDPDTLYVKGSGIALAECRPEDFVKMNRSALKAVLTKTYPPDPDQREQAVLADMMAARLPGEAQKRPSVETLLHDILPFALVVHTHPALVNGLTCSRQGAEAAKRLFPSAVWIPSINPGYILSKTVAQALDASRAAYGKPPEIIFLQNHGVFVGADTPAALDAQYRYIMETIESHIRRRPDFSGSVSAPPPAALPVTASRFLGNHEIARLVADPAAFAPVASAYTPDHIVYAGSDPLFIETGADIPQQWNAHTAKTGKPPKIVALQGHGVFGVGDSEKAAGLALALFADAVKVAAYTESFGGYRFMPPEQIEFINTWEVERYRSQVSA